MTAADSNTVFTGAFLFLTGAVLFFRMLQRQEKSEF